MVGQLPWDFEALLHKQFPGKAVVSERIVKGRLDFACGGFCGPNAVYAKYWFTFTDAQSARFHLSQRRITGYFGNYPRQVLIRGQSVACNERETKFLVEYADAISFTLGCLPPP
jgi:hypothetical protein